MSCCSVIMPLELTRQLGLASDSVAEASERYDSGMPGRAPANHLAKVYVEITSYCNLACEMCVRNAWDEPLGRMSLDRFRQLVAQLAPFQRPVTLMFACYGEPLSHPDLPAMIKVAKEADLTVEITTNGLLLDKAMARTLIELAVDRIWVSIDGASAQRYADIRRGGALDTVTRNLQDLFTARIQSNSYRPELGLVFVAMKSNIAELPAIRALASRVRAADVLVTNVLPHTPDVLEETLYRRTLNLAPYSPASITPRMHLPRLDINDLTAGPITDLMRTALDLSLTGSEPGDQINFCPFVHAGATAVRWDGAVSPCPPLLHTHPEYGVDRWRQIKHAAFGNLAEHDLLSIWQSAAYSDFRRRVRAFDFGPCSGCGGCDFADSNEEDCYGNPFPVCGGCLWAQGILRCP